MSPYRPLITAIAGRILLGLLLAGAGHAPLAASGRGRSDKRSKARPMPAPAQATADSAPGAGAIRPSVRVRGREVCAGADLRGADLRHADLRRCDLEQADLRGANLTGALLGGARCAGARLAGARLYKADILGAAGLDLRGARLHPFFEIEEDDQVGDLKILDLADPDHPGEGCPNHLTCAADGRLFWMAGRDPAIQAVSATGGRFSLLPQENHQLSALLKDSANRLWSFGDRRVMLLDLNQASLASAGEPIPCLTWRTKVSEPPLQVLSGPWGDPWLCADQSAARLVYHPGPEPFKPYACKAPNDAIGRSFRVALDRDGTWAYFVPLGQNQVFCYPIEPHPTGPLAYSRRERPVGLTFPEGVRSGRLVPGFDHRMWMISNGLEGIGEIDVQNRPCRLYHLEARNGRPVEPHWITAGPDQAMWFTERAGERIGRIDGKGGIQHFPLPPGWRPLEIVAGTDGCMLFTLEGRNAIGSIRYERRPATRMAAAPEPPAEAAQPPPAPEAEPEAVAQPAQPRRPERPGKPTARQRRAAAFARILRADERYLARQAAQAEEGKAVPQAGPEPTGIPMDLPAAEPVEPLDGDATPEERLESLGVLLAPSALNHILNFHGPRAPQGWTPLHPDFHAREALARLLADQLEQAGAIGRIRRPRSGLAAGQVAGAVRGAGAATCGCWTWRARTAPTAAPDARWTPRGVRNRPAPPWWWSPSGCRTWTASRTTTSSPPTRRRRVPPGETERRARDPVQPGAAAHHAVRMSRAPRPWPKTRRNTMGTATIAPMTRARTSCGLCSQAQRRRVATATTAK